MYKCLHSFIISNITFSYTKGQVIPATEYDGLPWGYKPYFALYDEKTSKNNASAIGDLIVK